MKRRQFIYSIFTLAFCLTVYLAGPRVFSLLARIGAPPEEPAEHYLVPVLCFHNLDGKGVYSISRHKFRYYLEVIRQEGIDVIPLRTLYEHARLKRPFRRPSMAITIDDDFPNIARVAVPILREYAFPATIFVYPKEISRRPRDGMSWPDLRRLNREGFDIQNHSFSHTRFHEPKRKEKLEDYVERVRMEIEHSRILIEKNIPGLKIYAFAYPFGYYSDFLRNKLFDAGYKLLLTTDAAPVDLSKRFTGTFDRFTIQKKKHIKDPEKWFYHQVELAKRRLSDGVKETVRNE